MKALRGSAGNVATGCGSRKRTAIAIVAGLASAFGNAAAQAQENPATPLAVAGEDGADKATRLLRPVAFRTHDASSTVDEEALLLRMTASANSAVPIQDLGDALITTGSVSPEPTPRELSAVLTSLLPTPPAAPAAGSVLAVSAGQTAPPSSVAAGESGRIVSSVKLRAKPDNAAGVVSVLAAQAPVTVLNCDYWCEIDAGGQRGFVFRKFVRTDAPSGQRTAEKQEP